MIVHQHIGVEMHTADGECLTQQVEIVQAVAVVEKAGQTIVAALHDVLRNTGKVEAGCAAHAHSIARQQAGVVRCQGRARTADTSTGTRRSEAGSVCSVCSP